MALSLMFKNVWDKLMLGHTTQVFHLHLLVYLYQGDHMSCF
jgi:hypothetical protein